MTTRYYGPKDRLKRHSIDIFDATFIVSLCHDINKMQKDKRITSLMGQGTEYPNAAGLCCYQRRNIAILLDRKSLDHNLIAHEVMHATHRLLEYCGMELTDSSGETYACLNGLMAKLVYEDLKQWGAKIK